MPLAAILLAVFAVFWLALAIAPNNRQDWALENLLVLIAIPWFAWTYRKWRYSNAAYVCLFLFFTLHAIGAHYTYSEVPYQSWLRPFTDVTSRNHFDRFVHFAYGLLVVVPSMELLERRAPPSGLWKWLLPVLFISSHSVIYETVEWAAAMMFGGDLGVAFLGTQGDPWDSQKDMFLASLGAAIGAGMVLAGRHRSTVRPHGL